MRETRRVVRLSRSVYMHINVDLNYFFTIGELSSNHRVLRRGTAGTSREKNCANEFTVIIGSGFYGLDYHTRVM